jgi:hypothetical protein
MAVDFIDIENHKNVYAAVFGAGDVYISQATNPGAGKAMVMFHNTNSEGEPYDFNGKRLDELPFPDMVLMFEDAATIARLINVLAKIQEETFLT